MTLRSNAGEGTVRYHTSTFKDLKQSFKVIKHLEELEGEGDVKATTLSYSVFNSTTFKYAFNKEVSERLKLTNNSFNWDLSYKPTKFNNDTSTMTLKHSSKYDTATGNVQNTESLKYGAPLLGPIRPWLTVSWTLILLSIVLNL